MKFNSSCIYELLLKKNNDKGLGPYNKTEWGSELGQGFYTTEIYYVHTKCYVLSWSIIIGLVMLLNNICNCSLPFSQSVTWSGFHSATFTYAIIPTYPKDTSKIKKTNTNYCSMAMQVLHLTARISVLFTCSSNLLQLSERIQRGNM